MTRPPEDLSSLSWDELVRRAATLPSPLVSFPSDSPSMASEGREIQPSSQELIEEISLIVSDTCRFHREHPERGELALLPAQFLASIRDRGRPASVHGSLGDLAALFAGWLLVRRAGENFAEVLCTAKRAIRETPPRGALASDLHDFVDGYLEGSIDDDELDQRLKQPPAARGRDAQAGSCEKRTHGVLLSSAASTLRAMLEDAGHERLARQPSVVWQVFREFARVPVTADAPDQLAEHDGDLLLFEWGRQSLGVSADDAEPYLIDLVRQFSVVDATGHYDHLEQLHCSILLPPPVGSCVSESGIIWSKGDMNGWFIEVEQSEAFALVTANREVLSINVWQEAV